ncbi:hypothetical protein BH10PSE12_BH10PSE12_01620 [soil metagenome]
MMPRTIAFAMATTLALAGCGKKDTAETGNLASVNAMNAASTAPVVALSAGQTFANAAAASDAFEVASSTLALTASSSASVKKFAQMMIDAHTKSTAKLKTAAAAASPAVVPDPSLNPDQQTKLDALKAATGSAFDQAYAADQVAGHQQTLDALKAYAAAGDVATLKSFATELVPTVTAHLNMAKGLKI